MSRSKNLLVSDPARALGKLWRASFRSRLAWLSSSALMCRRHTAYNRKGRQGKQGQTQGCIRNCGLEEQTRGWSHMLLTPNTHLCASSSRRTVRCFCPQDFSISAWKNLAESPISWTDPNCFQSSARSSIRSSMLPGFPPKSKEDNWVKEENQYHMRVASLKG